MLLLLLLLMLHHELMLLLLLLLLLTRSVGRTLPRSLGSVVPVRWTVAPLLRVSWHVVILHLVLHRERHLLLGLHLLSLHGRHPVRRGTSPRPSLVGDPHRLSALLLVLVLSEEAGVPLLDLALLLGRQPGQVPPGQSHLRQETHHHVLLEGAGKTERVERMENWLVLTGAGWEMGLLLELHLVRLRRLGARLGDRDLRWVPVQRSMLLRLRLLQTASQGVDR